MAGRSSDSDSDSDAGPRSSSGAEPGSNDALSLGPSATRGRLAVLAAVRATMPLAVFVALSAVATDGDRTRIAGLLTAQVMFGFAALALAAGRRAQVAAAAAWAAIGVDLVVIGAIVFETGGISGPLPFLLGAEALAVGMLFSAADGVRVLFGAVVVAGIGESMHSSTSPAGVVAFAGVLGVSATGLGLAALSQREARRRGAELATHRRIALDIQDSLSLGDILGELCRGVVNHLGFTTAVVLLPGRSGELVCAGSCGLSGRRDHPVQIRGGIADALRTGRTMIVGRERARATAELSALMGGRGYVAFPMGSEGLLVVTRASSGRRLLRRRSGRVRAHELEPLMSLAQQAALAVANARLHEHVSAMAITDPLTDLPNHREFQRVLAAECERQNRYSTLRTPGHHLSVLLIDIDHFKSVNDRYGHPAGDTVLKNAAAALRGAVRSFDLVARYGGEEFGVVLPETDERGALGVAERARRAVSAVVHEIDGTRTHVTVSVGVATAPEDGTAPAQLVAAADAALYRSKAAGRDRVTHASALGMRVHSITRRGARSA